MHLRRAQGAVLISSGPHLPVTEGIARADDHDTIAGLSDSEASAAAIR
jgi:hypothetical protein